MEDRKLSSSTTFPQGIDGTEFCQNVTVKMIHNIFALKNLRENIKGISICA